MQLRYKFVELAKVTGALLEDTVNEWVGQGWKLDDIRFVPAAGRRPLTAFVSFVRPDGGHGDAAPLRRFASASDEPRSSAVIELGELDLGDPAPWQAEVDWRAGQVKPAAAAAAAARKGKRKGR